MRVEAARVQALWTQSGLNVSGRVALVVAEVGERSGGAVGLLAIPDADVVGVGAGDEKQARAERLVPVGGRAEFVDGDVGEARGDFAAAIGAGGVGGVWHIGGWKRFGGSARTNRRSGRRERRCAGPASLRRWRSGRGGLH